MKINNKHKEQLSSLLDNELGSMETDELMQAIENNDDLHENFDRYALIREALNADVVVHQESFLRNVQDALVVEPTVLSPKRKKQQNNNYIAVALAASIAIFAVAIFDVGLFANSPSAPPVVAVIEVEQDTILALEEQQHNEAIQNDVELDVQLVTFEK